MLDTNVIYELMEENEIKTKMDLSRLTNIPYSTIIYMLQGHDLQVSTLIELAKFFKVPADRLIFKNYGVVAYSDEKKISVDTTNIIEATVSTMM